jgi:RsiW-degrading membrane proteinase PrsW (M82 family)
MRPVELLVIGAVSVVPLAIVGPFVARDNKGSLQPFRPGLIALALGVVAYFASRAAQLAAVRLSGLDLGAQPASGFVAIAYAFLIVGPVNEALRAAAAIPGLRSDRMRVPYDAMRVAIGAAAGFATCETVGYLSSVTVSSASVFRALAGFSAQVALTGMWGFALGRERRRRLGGQAFTRAFLVVVFFSALVHYLLFSRGESALWAALPLVVSACLAALVARRDLLRMGDPRYKRRLSRLLPLSPPTIEELELALLKRPDRPLMLRWIFFGALVTTGVLTAMIAGSVFVGHGAGVDFAAVDQEVSFDRSGPPLVLLGSAALGAFPVSGFLVARASAAQGVLEPALAAAVAIVGLVVLLGLAAPVAVVFGLALGPVAFALACAGAWAGLER